MEGQFHGRYGAYCANLAKDGVWGDELSLLGAAHILQRPIVVVTDSLSENEFCRQISPPALIDESNSIEGRSIQGTHGARVISKTDFS